MVTANRMGMITLLILPLFGCAGIIGKNQMSGCTGGFVDNAGVSLQNLQQQWSTAQGSVARGVVLNALQVTLTGAPPQKSAPNPSALNIQPDCVEVTAVQDAPVSQLVQYGIEYANLHDPTGLIICTECQPQVVHSYVYVNAPAKVFVASSIASYALEYEFENIILNQLGYDTSER